MKQKVYTFGKAMLIAGKELAKSLKDLEIAFSKLRGITGASPNCSIYMAPPSSNKSCNKKK